jgi:hypothetical protein
VDEVGRILPLIFKKQIRRAEPHLLEILSPLWPRIAGKNLAQHSLPVAFDAGVLTLTTDCPTWGAQLRHMTDEIRAGVNGFLGQPIVKKVVVKKVAQSGLFFAQETVGKGTPHTLPAAAGAVDTDAIIDPEVKQAVAGSYAKYFARHRR